MPIILPKKPSNSRIQQCPSSEPTILIDELTIISNAPKTWNEGGAGVLMGY